MAKCRRFSGQVRVKITLPRPLTSLLWSDLVCGWCRPPWLDASNGCDPSTSRLSSSIFVAKGLSSNVGGVCKELGPKIDFILQGSNPWGGPGLVGKKVHLCSHSVGVLSIRWNVRKKRYKRFTSQHYRKGRHFK